MVASFSSSYLFSCLIPPLLAVSVIPLKQHGVKSHSDLRPFPSQAREHGLELMMCDVLMTLLAGECHVVSANSDAFFGILIILGFY